MPGTYHFYRSDNRFNRLVRRPEQLVRSGCRVAVEVNWSTHAAMSESAVRLGIARKRWMAAYWQSRGVRIVVDLNVEPVWRHLALLGVPRGWSAYATRSQRGIPVAEVHRDYALAREHAGGIPCLFVVFGGGQTMARVCADQGWTHVPEPAHVAIGRTPAYGTRSRQ